jgi:hypothetical protein
MSAEPIRYYDRYARTVKTEQVYGEAWLRFAYENPAGRFFVWLAARRVWFSKWYGRKMNKRVSAQRILPFITAYNIDVGTAYLHLLQTVYLSDIQDPQSRRYAVISAYNGGAGGVLNTFSSDRKAAPSMINQLSPEAVYQVLTEQHPKAEARRYLYKVNQAEKGFKRKFASRSV